MLSGVSTNTSVSERDCSDIRRLREMWVEAFNERDLERVVNVYAADAVELPLNGMPAVHGINAISESVKSSFANRFGELRVRQTQVGYTEPLAVELATYLVRRHGRKGEAEEEKGRLVATWRRDETGRFRITISVWSKETV
ncbi:MAG TPA: SgcJ/EcaC family oxidoreductase [Candidatus Acidoferrales bacterium]|nr:SgcJ/EcaC family oxidoreductase [Candidatus Acidoferrales bacterium]